MNGRTVAGPPRKTSGKGVVSVSSKLLHSSWPLAQEPYSPWGFDYTAEPLSNARPRRGANTVRRAELNAKYEANARKYQPLLPFPGLSRRPHWQS